MADRKTIKFGPEWLRNVASPATSGNGVDNNPSPERNYHRAQSVPSNTNQRGGPVSVAPKYQRAEFRYGREELLAIFDVELEPPPLLQRFDSLFVTTAQLPFALSEKNYESDLADNGNGEILGRGTSPGDRFGQPKRGLSETSFRGRAAFGYTGRGRSSYDLNPSEARPATTRSWSSSATTVQTTSAKSPVAEDWNSRNQKNRWTETSNWRRKPQNPVTGKAFGEDSEGIGWRNTDPPQSRPLNQDKSRGDYAGRGVRYVPRRQWSGDLNNSEDHLPEWAVDSNVNNSGGTFDSSGAFHGSSDDSVLNRPTGDGFHGLSRSQTQGSISLRKEAHPDDGPVEDWWDSEKARKLQPPKLPTVDFKHGKPIVPAFEEKTEPETAQEKSSQLNIKKIDINDTKHKKIEPVTQHKPCDSNRVEKHDETNENRPEIKEKHDVILKQRSDQRVLQAEINPNVNLEQVPSFSEPVQNKKTLELENEHLGPYQALSIRPAATPIFGAPPAPDADKWYYEDPQNQTQGPFTSAEMSQWWREGFFNTELKVRRGGEPSMRALRELGGVPPFVLDVLPPSPPMPIQQAYCFPPSRNLESNAGIFGVPPRDLPEPAFSPLQRVLPSYQPLPPEPMSHGSLNTDHLSNLYKFNNEVTHNFIEEAMVNLTRPIMSSISQERQNYVNNSIDHITGIPFPARVPNVEVMTPPPVMTMPPDLGFANLINPQTQTSVNNTYQNVSHSRPNKPPSSEVDNLWGPMTNIRWSVQEPKSIPDNDLWNTTAPSNISTFLPNKNKIDEDTRLPLKPNLEHKVPPPLMSNPIQQLEKISIREALLPNVLEVSKLESKVHEEIKNSLLDISKSQSIQKSVEASKIVDQKPQLVSEPKLSTKTPKSEKKAIAKEAQQTKQTVVVEAEKQSKTKSKTKENTQPVQNQKKKKDEEKTIVEEQKRTTAQPAAPRPAPWSAQTANNAAPNCDKLTLDEIQKLEREKKAEQLKEQQQAVQILAQQHQAALAREHEMAFSWAKNKATGNSAVPVKSLAVIQAEEAKRVAAQMSTPPPAIVAEPVTAFAPWAAPVAKPVNVSGFWDTLPTTTTSKPERPAKTNPAPAKKQTKQPSAPQPKQTSNPKKNNNIEFDSWCIDALKTWSYQIDVPTFIGFLKDIESPFDVKDYVRCYLGEGKDAQEFSKQFIEKRSKLLRKSVVLSVDDLCSPAPALNSAANDYGDAKGKGKKTKKNKMQKVDARILGFSVTAAEDRINVGDIDSV